MDYFTVTLSSTRQHFQATLILRESGANKGKYHTCRSSRKHNNNNNIITKVFDIYIYSKNTVYTVYIIMQHSDEMLSLTYSVIHPLVHSVGILYVTIDFLFISHQYNHSTKVCFLNNPIPALPMSKLIKYNYGEYLILISSAKMLKVP